MIGRDIESGPCSWEEFRHLRENHKLSGEELDPVGLYTWIAAFKNGAYKFPAIVFETNQPENAAGLYNIQFEIRDESAQVLSSSDSFFQEGMYMRERIKDGENGIHTPTLVLPERHGVGGLILTGYFCLADESEPLPAGEAAATEEMPLPSINPQPVREPVGMGQERRMLGSV